MSKNSIDKLFKDKLQGHEEAYPEHLWEGVSQAINGEKKNRKGFFWYHYALIGALLLVTAGGVWFLMDVNDERFIGPDDQEMQQSEAEQTEINSEQASVDERELSQGDMVVNQKDINQESSLDNQRNEANSHLENYSNSEADKIVSTTSGRNILDQNDGVQRNVQRNEDQEAKSTPLSNVVANGTNLSGSTMSDFRSDKTSTEGSSTTGLTSKSLSLGQKRNKLEVAQLYPSAFRSAISEDLLTSGDRQLRESVADLNGFGKNRFIGRWHASAVYGANYVMRTLDISSESTLKEALRNQRNGTESFVNSFTTGLELSLKVRNWSVYTGAHYTQINERVNYVLDNVERIKDGVPVTGSLELSIINRFRMLSVPVYVGYEYRRGAWGLEALAGVNLGLMMDVSGRVFDELSLDYVEYQTGDRVSPYKENFGMSYVGAMSLSYYTGYGQSFFLRPSFVYYPGSFTKDGYGIEQKYKTIGLMAGYKIML